MNKLEKIKKEKEELQLYKKILTVLDDPKDIKTNDKPKVKTLFKKTKNHFNWNAFKRFFVPKIRYLCYNEYNNRVGGKYE